MAYFAMQAGADGGAEDERPRRGSGASARWSWASIASAKQKSIGVSVETRRLPSATPGRVAKAKPAMPPMRGP